jgi:hypothetical protein
MGALNSEFPTAGQRITVVVFTAWYFVVLMVVCGFCRINDCTLATTTKQCEWPGFTQSEPSTVLTSGDCPVSSGYPWYLTLYRAKFMNSGAFFVTLMLVE